MVITTAQLHSTKPELRFCAGSNPARGVSEIRDGEDLWQWSRLEIRLNAFRRSAIPQNQFITIIIIIISMYIWYIWYILYIYNCVFMCMCVCVCEFMFANCLYCYCQFWFCDTVIIFINHHPSFSVSFFLFVHWGRIKDIEFERHVLLLTVRCMGKPAL